MANVIIHGLDHNAIVRLLSEEMSLESMQLRISYDPGCEEPKASICHWVSSEIESLQAVLVPKGGVEPPTCGL